MRETDIFHFVFAMALSGLVTSCVAPAPAPFSSGSPTDPQVHGSSKLPRLIAPDEITQEVEQALSATAEEAKSAESMHHDMQNMPGMKPDEMQHSDQAKMQHGAAEHPDKKAMAEKMKKTSDEMKAASDAMKRRSNEMKTAEATYTCPMHPQVRSPKPGKCPICGTTLIRKQGVAPK